MSLCARSLTKIEIASHPMICIQDADLDVAPPALFEIGIQNARASMVAGGSEGVLRILNLQRSGALVAL